MTAANALYGVILNHLQGKIGLSPKYVRARNRLLEEVGADKLPPCVRGKKKLGACSEYFQKRATSPTGRVKILKAEFAALRGTRLRSGSPRAKPVVASQTTRLAIFISHSSDDTRLAGLLIGLLRHALPSLKVSSIRCTSVDPYRLAAGDKTDDVLRREVGDARIFIGLITPQSLRSVYVLFEIGARWGLEPHLDGGSRPTLIPLIAQMKPSDVERPLSNFNLLNLAKRPELHSLVDQIAKTLDLEPAAPAAYSEALEKVKRAAKRP